MLTHFQAHFDFIGGMLCGIALTFLVVLMLAAIRVAGDSDKRSNEEMSKLTQHNNDGREQ